MQNHAVIIDRVADTVNRRHGAHNQHIASLEQTFGRRQTHLFDVFIDRRIFFNEQITRRHIRFGLIVVVVGDEIFHRVLGKKFAKLRIQLCRQGLVRREHKGRATNARDDIRHRISLARAGHAEQGLKRQTVVDAFGQQAYRRGLVARR